MLLSALPKEGRNTAHLPKDLSKVAFSFIIHRIHMFLSAFSAMMAIARLSQDREVFHPNLDILPCSTHYSLYSN